MKIHGIDYPGMTEEFRRVTSTDVVYRKIECRCGWKDQAVTTDAASVIDIQHAIEWHADRCEYAKGKDWGSEIRKRSDKLPGPMGA